MFRGIIYLDRGYPALTMHALPGTPSMTTVLIIEDDEKSRRLLCDVLSYHGFAILQTDRGEEIANSLRPINCSISRQYKKLPSWQQENQNDRGLIRHDRDPMVK